MKSNKLFLLMAMVVLAVFAVGSVSAAENVTTDIDAQTDDIVLDEVSVEEDVNQDVSNSYDVYNTTTNIQDYIDNHSVLNFAPGLYADSSFNLHSDLVLNGNGAVLVGTGSNHVFNLPNNVNNITITGFNINVNDDSNNYSAVYGSFVTNAIINNNTFHSGANGININKYYNNITVEDNIIYDMSNDGISFAHPNSNSGSVDNLGVSYISRNSITDCLYGIFIGGNFKGVIEDNTISNCMWGIQSAGKKNGVISSIVANITGNTISGVQTGIEFINMTAISLNFISNNIYTNNYMYNYTVNYGGSFSNLTNTSISFYHNILGGAIKRSLINMTYQFENWFDGRIWEDQ